MPTDNPFANMEEAWLTNVTPCHNDENRIADMIMSVLTQDYPYTELIVVNDGSTDRSRKRILDTQKKLTAEQRSRFKFIDLKENIGACRARNLGASHRNPKTKYLSFLPADAYLYPGAVKFWVNQLENNPQASGIYGLYKFVDPKQPFNLQDNEGYIIGGQPFDPYLLETANYIDGTFPIRVELFDKMAEWNNHHYGNEVGAWDYHIKSLQDYEYWLHAVKQHGAQLLFAPSVFFETDVPHKGGLSADSNANWLERMDAIKQKHNIPIRKLCVIGMGAEFHAVKTAQMLDADFSKNPNFKPNHYECFYIMGGYPMFAMDVAKALRKYGNENVYSPAKFMMHWIGSDLLHLRELSRNALEKYTTWLKNIIDVHLVEAPHTQKELKELTGIRAKIVPLPSSRMFDVMPPPAKPVVAVYQPGGKVNRALYLSELVESVAKKMPKVQFLFYGTYDDAKHKKGNVTYLPWNSDPDNMKKIVADSTILLRLTAHDGLPLSIGEFASAGRNVVTNVPVPFCRVITGDMTADGIVKTIQLSLKDPVNMDGVKYYTKLFDKKQFKKSIYKLAEFDPKDYWEKRSKSWDIQAEQDLSKHEVRVVTNLIKRHGLKSVLDVGFGNGVWSEHLPADYVGIDIAKNNVEIAKHKFPDKEFIATSLEEAGKNLKTEKRDVAFCHTVLMHITEENMPTAIQSLKGLAKKAIIIEPTKIETGFYQIKHDIPALFDVELTIPLPSRTLYLCNLE